MMIALTSDGNLLIVLDDTNINLLKEGKPARAPEAVGITIAYCPDLVWIIKEFQKLAESGEHLNNEMIQKILDEGLKQPPNPTDSKRVQGEHGGLHGREKPENN
jgi:hypothetical protein